MNFVVRFCCLLSLFFIFVLGEKSSLDTPMVIKWYRALKEMNARLIDGVGYTTGSRERGDYRGRVQRRISNEVPFPCDVTEGRSKTVPKSVHKLRPGDIDVIGAMGDSLTAGSGSLAKNIFGILVENRGVTALGGGRATWREYLTIPNIIKEYNPNVIGYSEYDSLAHHAASGFNVAEIASMSEDLPFMAENLIERIKNHPAVNFEKSWKLISIFMGANNFCSDMCWRPQGPWSILKDHKNDLIRTLKIFKSKLPRSLISIIVPPNVIFLITLPNKPLWCRIITDVECACLMGSQWRNRIEEFTEIIKAWQRLDEEIANDPEFQTEEFAVVVQPFLTNVSAPFKPDGTPDWRYLSTDCFHLSQLGNARVTRALWRNILEPVGQKSHSWYDDEILDCPTKSHPYISTLINSRGRLKS